MGAFSVRGIGFERKNHDTIVISRNGTVIYSDPFKLDGPVQAAAIILVSHPHFDHASPKDLARIATEKTLIIGPADVKATLVGVKGAFKSMKPGETIVHEDIRIQAVPAYNTDKRFHPKEKGWCGFIVTVDGVSVYLAGDTDHIPEMREFPRLDVAFLPVSGTYVMTAEEAAQAALSLRKPGIVVPMHYGDIVGNDTDADRFERLVKKTAPECVIKR